VLLIGNYLTNFQKHSFARKITRLAIWLIQVPNVQEQSDQHAVVCIRVQTQLHLTTKLNVG